MARFIVLIPTLNGARTVDDTLATCSAQDHEDVRIVVSDNRSEDATADLVRTWQARDRRIEYMQPDRRLSMASHWEFALRSLAQEDAYLIVLGCDDVLMPGALRYASELLGMFPAAQCLAWNTNYYHTHDLPDPSVAGRLMLHLGGHVEVREARTSLRHVASGQMHYIGGLPNVYHGLVHTALLRELAHGPGPMIRSGCCDMYLALAICCLLKQYVFVREPLSLNVISRQSNGFSHSNDHADKEIVRQFMQDNDRPYHPDLPLSDDLHIAHVECLLQVRDAGLLPHDIPIDFKLMFGQAVWNTYGNYQSHTRQKRLGQLKIIARKYFLESFMEELEVACRRNDLARLLSLVPTAWVTPPYDYDAQVGRDLVLSPRGAALLAGELVRADRRARGEGLNQAGRRLDLVGAEQDQAKMTMLVEDYRRMISSVVGDLWSQPDFIRCYIGNVKSRPPAFNPAPYLSALSVQQAVAELRAEPPDPVIEQRGGGACVIPSAEEKALSKQAEERTVEGHQSKAQATLSIFFTDLNSGDPRLGIPYCCGQRRFGWKGTLILPENRSIQVGPDHVWLIQRRPWVPDQATEQAQKDGTRIVHDLDDLLWDIPADNPNKTFFTDARLAILFQQLRRADQVTVSTEPLAEELLKKGIRSVVLPNCVAAERWTQLRPARRTGKRPRVGWAGQSNVHFADLELLRQVMDDLGNEVEWVFLGETPVFARESGRQVESVSMVPIQQYPAQLAALNLDLALAPLALNRFNEAKSDIRLLHYGALGYPVVATDIVPHRQAPVKLVPNLAAAWVEAIRERISDLDAAAQEGERLREWVFANRSIDVWITKYAAAWFGSDRDDREAMVRTEIRAAMSRVPTFSCSIIMPVYNNVELTRQSLTALSKVTDGCEYEVIVVDNHSTDGTREFLSSLGGDVQIIRNEENLGFAKACNQGAAAARGRYLVFLNNDTIPQVGWLEVLVREVEQDQEVAVVGSKLLYGNGTIQHAGVVFSRATGIPFHLYRRFPGDSPAVNRRREFQCVTAACMLVRRESFEEVGGFDEAYRNGFEDVDLCLKIREKGHRVVYQPRSVVIHLEEQTPGRKMHDGENMRLFMSRWGKSWWLADEDLCAYTDGFKLVGGSQDEQDATLLIPLTDLRDRAAWAHVAAAQASLQKKDWDGVKRELSLVQDWPGDRSVLSWAARVCEELDEPALCHTFLTRYLELTDSPTVRRALVRSLLEYKSLAAAEQQLDILLAGSPDDAEGLILRGLLCMQREQYREAETAFSVAMRQGADCKKCLMGMGVAAMGRAYAQGAWERFVQVLVDHPNDAEAIHWLLRAGTAQNRWEELADHLRAYVTRNPSDLAIRFALASVLFRGDQIEAARRVYEALRMDAPAYDGLDQLGQMIAGREAPLTTGAVSS